jgi:hypothetical protein
VKGSKYSRTCKVCKQKFDVKVMRNGRPSARKTCSQKCSVTNRVSGVTWTQAEIDFLTEHAMATPFHRIVRGYRVWARMNGHNDRTKEAIDHKLRRMGYSTRTEIDFYTFNRLSEMLGLSRYTVAGWKRLKENPLQAYQHDGKRKAFNYVSRAEFLKFARNHPECLGGANEIGLQVVLEDVDLAREILRKYPKRHSPLYESIRVRCIETGKIYPSLGAAARDIYVTRQTLSRAIHVGHRANGLHFEQV